MKRLVLAFAALLGLVTPAFAQNWQPVEGDAILKDFRFGSGERMPELKVHYRTLGTPVKNKLGEIENAIMVLHGTGGSGAQFLVPQFADELFGPGQPLDITKYYVILPDNIGHGASSKPSDGMKMAFPAYDYGDMVRAQRRMLTEHLKVRNLQLILGTSMGCMHAFVWGTEYPGFAKRLAPFACNPIEIAGRNRMWRKMSIDAIKADPAWNGGNYTSPPEQGLRTMINLQIIAGENPLRAQHLAPTRVQAETYLADAFKARRDRNPDANDVIYWLDSSRNYNPFAKLGRITVPVLWINSADDFINPAGVGGSEEALSRMPRALYILIGASTATRGHGTHTWAAFWKKELGALLSEPAP
jgi:homoserine O-acetyltransferase